MKKRNYLLVSLVLCGMVVASNCGAAAAAAKKLPSVTIYFNGREADLEKPLRTIDGKLYITFVDLVRHVGGVLNWGPKEKYTEAHRGELVVRVTPGTKQALVNGLETPIDGQTRRIGSRTYVPLEAYCNVFGVNMEKDALLPRISIRWSEK